MFCVIQEIELKKENTCGEYKGIESYYWTGNGNRRYAYRYCDERYKREIKKAYRISIHKSYRENGKVKKKQKVICTMGYYDIVDYGGYIGDCCLKIEDKASELGLTLEELEKMVYEKFDPIIKKVEEEFKSTEEYQAKLKNEEILNKYRENKIEFEKKYGADIYEYYFDVFGELKEKEMFEIFKKQFQERKEREQKAYEDFKSSEYDFSGYYKNNQSNYNEDDKPKYKKIYKTLASKFHPDIYGDNGDMMKFINQLKEEWGL